MYVGVPREAHGRWNLGSCCFKPVPRSPAPCRPQGQLFAEKVRGQWGVQGTHLGLKTGPSRIPRRSAHNSTLHLSRHQALGPLGPQHLSRDVNSTSAFTAPSELRSFLTWHRLDHPEAEPWSSRRKQRGDVGTVDISHRALEPPRLGPSCTSHSGWALGAVRTGERLRVKELGTFFTAGRRPILFERK